MAIAEKKRKLLEEFVGGKCEQCGKETRLTAHRLRRDWQGGTYEHRNIKMLCNECHKLMHANEYSNVQGK